MIFVLLFASGSILEEFSEKVKEYMRENMSTSAAKKKKKKKDKKKETEDQPSSSTHSSRKGSMFDKLDRPRSTAHKKAAAVPGEAEDQPPLPLRRATRSTTQSSAQPATRVPSSDAATANVATSSVANLPADVATTSTFTLPPGFGTPSEIRVPKEGIPSDSYEPVVTSSPNCPYKVYKMEGKEEEHQRGNE